MSSKQFGKWIMGLACLGVGASRVGAEQLIQTPTANLVTGPTVEYRQQLSGSSEGYGSLEVPVGKRFEAMFRWYHRYSGQNRIEGGGQVQILPDGLITPGLAVGVWDLTNSSPKGRRAFLMLTKSLAPEDFLLLKGFPPMTLNFGVGTGKFSGPMAGLKIDLPAHFQLVGEYDARRFNTGLWYSPVRALTLKVELQNGEPFFGGTLRARF